MLMKGSLHTDELMRAVTAKVGGLRTDRRISHVFVMDVPAYAETIFVTDAAINIFPDLDAKRDIIQNAIDLYNAGWLRHIAAGRDPFGGRNRDHENPFDDRGGGALQDGRPRPDHRRRARRPAGVRQRHRRGGGADQGHQVRGRGRAQILVVPDLEAGNMLAKNLAYFAKADGAGIVLGARVPIVLTSRADSARARMASCAVAALFADARRQHAPTAAA